MLTDKAQYDCLAVLRGHGVCGHKCSDPGQRGLAFSSGNRRLPLQSRWRDADNQGGFLPGNQNEDRVGNQVTNACQGLIQIIRCRGFFYRKFLFIYLFGVI